MRRNRKCGREGPGVCSCEMGNFYRFAEPIVLVSIARLGQAYGYSIAHEAQKMAVTHAGLDTGVVYRTLHRLEVAGMVVSTWDTAEGRAARRVYTLTSGGKTHIAEWAEILDLTVSSLEAIRNACRGVAEV